MPMCFIYSLIPAAIFAVIGYFVLFCSTKTAGSVHKFGQDLAILIFILAVFFPIMGAYVTISGQCPTDHMEMMEQAQEMMEQNSGAREE